MIRRKIDFTIDADKANDFALDLCNRFNVKVSFGIGSITILSNDEKEADKAAEWIKPTVKKKKVTVKKK